MNKFNVRNIRPTPKKRINKKDVTVGYRYGLRAELQLTILMKKKL
jgi:hypothetical protein